MMKIHESATAAARAIVGAHEYGNPLTPNQRAIAAFGGNPDAEWTRATEAATAIAGEPTFLWASHWDAPHAFVGEPLIAQLSADTRRDAIVAAMAPFGSLAGNAEAITTALIAHFDVHTPGSAAAIVEAVWAYEADVPAAVEIGWHDVTLVTPTSKTRLLFQARTTFVSFGPNGSRGRAAQMLAAHPGWRIDWKDS